MAIDALSYERLLASSSRAVLVADLGTVFTKVLWSTDVRNKDRRGLEYLQTPSGSPYIPSQVSAHINGKHLLFGEDSQKVERDPNYVTFIAIKLHDVSDEVLQEGHGMLAVVRDEHEKVTNAVQQQQYSIVLPGSGTTIQASNPCASDLLDIYIEWLGDSIKSKIKRAKDDLTTAQLEEVFGKFERTIVTVPSSWSSGVVQKYLERFQKAGFPNPVIETEAGCAVSSIAYYTGPSVDLNGVSIDGQIVMVVDVGGATATVSLWRPHKGGFRLLSKTLDPLCGGLKRERDFIVYFLDNICSDKHRKLIVGHTRLSVDELREQLSSDFNRALQKQTFDPKQSRALKVEFSRVDLPDIADIQLEDNILYVSATEVTRCLNRWITKSIKPLITRQFEFRDMIVKYRDAPTVLCLFGGSTLIGRTSAYLQDRLESVFPQSTGAISGEAIVRRIASTSPVAAGALLLGTRCHKKLEHSAVASYGVLLPQGSPPARSRNPPSTNSALQTLLKQSNTAQWLIKRRETGCFKSNRPKIIEGECFVPCTEAGGSLVIRQELYQCKDKQIGAQDNMWHPDNAPSIRLYTKIRCTIPNPGAYGLLNDRVMCYGVECFKFNYRIYRQWDGVNMSIHLVVPRNNSFSDWADDSLANNAGKFVERSYDIPDIILYEALEPEYDADDLAALMKHTDLNRVTRSSARNVRQDRKANQKGYTRSNDVSAGDEAKFKESLAEMEEEEYDKFSDYDNDSEGACDEPDDASEPDTEATTDTEDDVEMTDASASEDSDASDSDSTTVR